MRSSYSPFYYGNAKWPCSFKENHILRYNLMGFQNWQGGSCSDQTAKCGIRLSRASQLKGPDDDDDDDDDEVFFMLESSQTTKLELYYHAWSVSVQMTTLLGSLSIHWHCFLHCSWSVKRHETMELKLLFEKGCSWWNLPTISFTL